MKNKNPFKIFITKEELSSILSTNTKLEGYNLINSSKLYTKKIAESGIIKSSAKCKIFNSSNYKQQEFLLIQQKEVNIIWQDLSFRMNTPTFIINSAKSNPSIILKLGETLLVKKKETLSMTQLSMSFISEESDEILYLFNNLIENIKLISKKQKSFWVSEQADLHYRNGYLLVQDPNFIFDISLKY